MSNINNSAHGRSGNSSPLQTYRSSLPPHGVMPSPGPSAPFSPMMSASVRISSPTPPPAVFSSGSQPSLAHFLLEYGPKSVLREYFPSLVATHFGPLKESDVAQVLGMMAATQTSLTLSLRTNKLQITNPLMASSSSSQLSSTAASSSILPPPPDAWQWVDFVDCILEMYPYLNWTLIVQSLDYPEFFIHDIKGVEVIVRVFYFATKNMMDFPIFLFWKVWDNVTGQLSFLKHAMMASPELMVFPGAIKESTRHLLTPEDLEGVPLASPTRHALLHLFHQPWNALEFLDLVCHLLDVPPCYEDARSLLELAAKQAPELLCLGLAVLRPPWPSPIGDLLLKLATGFMAGQPGAPIVLPRLWRLAPPILLAVMSDMHRRDPTCLSRLLDIAQELKALPRVLADARPFSFVIDLAALASRREHLNLDKWLQEAVRERREPFIRSLVEFIWDRSLGTFKSSIPLSSEALALMMKTLCACLPLMSADTMERFSLLQSKLSDVDHLVPKAVDAQDDPLKDPLFSSFFESSSFPSDVEAEANACYERIYAQEASVQDVLETMVRLKKSSLPRDNAIFSCMVHNLLDEYRFFSKYPEKELALTGVIFGQLIHKDILGGPALGIALRFIMDSMAKSQVDSKLWRFGLTAVAQCAEDLARWPSLCTRLMECPGMASFPAVAERLRATSLMDTKNGSHADQTLLYLFPRDALTASVHHHHSHPSSSSSTFCSLSEYASRPLVAEIERLPCQFTSSPEASFQERVFFVVNNLSMANIDDKIKDMVKIFSEQDVRLLGWLAQYIVMKRVAIEPNYHQLYAVMATSPMWDTIIHCGSSLLARLCLLSGVLQARALISDENTKTSTVDRSSLKNIGAWIGLLTIARNRPLLHRHIPIKDVLLEGHDLDRLIVVVPFACKIMEAAVKSVVFVPRNPWLMGVLSLLVDLYTSSNLKLTLKFEIEVLFKTLKIDMSSVSPARLVHAPRTSLEIYTPPSAMDHHPTSHSSMSSSLQPPVSLSPKSMAGLSALTPCLPTLGQDIIIPRIRTPLPASFFKVVVLSFEFALREVSASVIERAVSIAFSTTSTLISKDFPEMASSTLSLATGMISSLVCYLIGGTARDPLRSALLSTMASFSGLAMMEPIMVESSVPSSFFSLVVEENLEMALEILEKLALEKATALLTSSFPMKGASSPTNNTINNVVCAVYDDFGKLMPAKSASGSQVPVLTPLSQSDYDRATAALRPQGDSSPQPSVQVPPASSALSSFSNIMAKIMKMVMECPNPNISFSSFPQNHELRALMKQVLVLALHSPSRDDTCILFSQKIISSLLGDAGKYEPSASLLSSPSNALFIQVHVVLLDKLCELSSRVAREVTTWIVYSSDSRKYNVAVTVSFFLSGLVSIMEYDAHLAAKISAENSKAEDDHTVGEPKTDADNDTICRFAVDLVRRCIIVTDRGQGFESGGRPVSTPFEWALTLEALDSRRRHDDELSSSPSPLSLSIDGLKTECAMAVGACKSSEAISDLINIICTMMVGEWARLCQVVSSSEKSFSSLVHQLFRLGICRDDVLLDTFMDTLVNGFIMTNSSQTGERKGNMNMAAVNAIQTTSRPAHALPGHVVVAKLLVHTVRCLPPSSPKGVIGRSEFLGRFLGRLGEALASHPDVSIVSFLVHLLGEWHASERVMDTSSARTTSSAEIHVFIGQWLHIVRPTVIPHFTAGWIEVMSHRFFLPRLLLGERSSWAIYHTLLLDLLSAIAALLRTWRRRIGPSAGTPNTAGTTGSSSSCLSLSTTFVAVVKVFLLLLHDFPEFLAAHHATLCAAIPPALHQLRNLVLSAFPRHLKLLDPFTPSLKLEMLPECLQEPLISPDILAVSANVKAIIDEYVDSVRSPGSLSNPNAQHSPGNAHGSCGSSIDQVVSILKAGIMDRDSRSGAAMAATATATGISSAAAATSNAWSKRPSSSSVATASGNTVSSVIVNAMVIYVASLGGSLVDSGGHLLIALLGELDEEGRYALLGAMANQLRYPNSHTLYYYNMMKTIFERGGIDFDHSCAIREQAARVLLERLIVQRPHPWGLLITFIDIIKNPHCKFWSLPFTRSTPEVERLFESVARSCMVVAQETPHDHPLPVQIQ